MTFVYNKEKRRKMNRKEKNFRDKQIPSFPFQWESFPTSTDGVWFDVTMESVDFHTTMRYKLSLIEHCLCGFCDPSQKEMVTFLSKEILTFQQVYSILMPKLQKKLR